MERIVKNYTDFLNEAYVSKEKMKQVQQDIKREFPDFKFSIRKENYSKINVSILSGPIELTNKPNGYEQISSHWYESHYKDNPEMLSFFEKLFKIIEVGNWDRSDPMTDYFDVGFYVQVSIGQWDRPYVVTTNKKKIDKPEPKFNRFVDDIEEEKPKNLRYFEKMK